MYVVYKTTPIVILAKNGGTTLFPRKDHPWCLTDEARTNGVKVLYNGAVPARIAGSYAFAANFH